MEEQKVMTNIEALKHYEDFLYAPKHTDMDYDAGIRNAAYQFAHFLEAYTVYVNDYWFVRSIIKDEIEGMIEKEFDYSNKKDKRDDKHRASSAKSKLKAVIAKVKRELELSVSMRWKNPE